LRHPELADRLAAAHALGTLRGGARRRFEALSRHDPRLRALALIWQERIAAMTELQPQQGPRPEVWKRIERELRREPDPDRATWLSRWLWPGMAGAGALASVAAVLVIVQLVSSLQARDGALAQLQADRQAAVQRNAQLVSELGATPNIRYVAVLEDDRSAPALLVSFDIRSSTLTLRRLGDYREGAERSLQLWALPAGGGPRSLGVLDEGGVVRLATQEQQVREVPALAISLEPKGGVPSERGPTGPVLFKGPLLPM